jgi:hypothetical protein
MSDREELNSLKAQLDLASIFELNGLKLKPRIVNTADRAF